MAAIKRRLVRREQTATEVDNRYPRPLLSFLDVHMADLPPKDHDPRHFRPNDLLVSNEDVDEALPTPPYKRYPTSIQDEAEAQSPPYKSRSRVDLVDEKDRRMGSNEDEKATSNKPTVHYPDELAHGPAPAYATKPLRLDSGDGLSSKAPSLAGTDDEDEEEDYNWSDEDDLVDEEAKFEKKMGVSQKARGWGCMRCVQSVE